MAYDDVYPTQQLADRALIEPQRPTVSERLTAEKQRLEARLAEVNAAIAALEKNPEVSEAVDALSKLGHF